MYSLAICIYSFLPYNIIKFQENMEQINTFLKINFKNHYLHRPINIKMHKLDLKGLFKKKKTFLVSFNCTVSRSIRNDGKKGIAENFSIFSPSLTPRLSSHPVLKCWITYFLSSVCAYLSTELAMREFYRTYQRFYRMRWLVSPIILFHNDFWIFFSNFKMLWKGKKCEY